MTPRAFLIKSVWHKPWLTLLIGILLLVPPALHPAAPTISALAPIETLLDNRQELVGVAVEANGTIYVSDRAAGLIYRLPPAGPLTVPVAGLDHPAGLAIDEAGRLLIAEEKAGRILRLEPSGALSVVAAALKSPRWLALGPDGALYLSAHRLHGQDGADPTEGREILRLGPDASLTVVATGLRRLEGLALLDGHLVAATKGLTSGPESTGTLLRFHLLPDGGLGAPAPWVDTGLKQPVGLAPDALSALYVSSKELSTELDTARRAIGKVHPDRHLSTFAQHLDDPQGLALAPDGSLLLADGRVGRLLRFRAPAAPVLDPLPTSTALASLAVTGTTEPSAYLDLFVNDANPPITGTAGAAGAFALSVALTSNATNTLEVLATTHGGDGLTSAPASATIVHDDQSPTVAFTSPAAGAPLQGTVPVTATASDAKAHSLLTVKADGVILAVANTSPLTTPLDTTGLSEGAHTLAAIARDQAGNEASITLAITTDNSPPLLAITEPADGGTLPTRTPTMSLSYSDATTGVNLSTLRVLLDGADITSAFTAAPTGATATLTTPLASGPHTLQVSIADRAGNMTSASSLFTVSTGPDFSLSATPTTASVVPGTGTTFFVTVVPFNNYTNLIHLSLTGLPGGVTATLTPPQLAPGRAALLAFTVPSALAPGTYAFTVTGTGLVSESIASRSASGALAVLSQSTTALAGRVLTTEELPLPNVTIRLGTLTAQTDGAGNFLITNPPSGEQVVLIDGSTASTPTTSYPTIPVTVTIVPGQVTSVGFTPHLHAQPAGRTVSLIPGQATVVTDPAIPGLIVQIPAGVTIVGWDGQPNTQLGMRHVPPDRSPLPPLEVPPGFVAGGIYMFYFGKVGGGFPTAPVPIIGPNDGVGFPGEPVDLYFYDEAPDGSRPNAWAKYGTGTVSSDGTQILPDPDPATAQPYGMPRFCCGAWRPVYPPPPPQTRPPSALAVNLPALGQGPSGGEPVDLASGLFVLQKTDLVLPGRLPLALTRTYRTLDSSPGPFGPGTSHAYEVFLQSLSPDAMLLTLPGNSRALFSRQPDGTFRNGTEPGLRGAVVTLSGSDRLLTFKDGTVWTFDGNGRLIVQRDRNENTLTIGRDGQGRVTSLTEPAGRSFTFGYSGTSLQITQVTDPIARTVRYGYDGAGRLSSVTDSAGGVTTYTYDSANRLTTITDPRGILFLRNEYDSAGRVSRQIQADGGVFTFSYTLTSGAVTQTVVTDPRGNRTTSRFNTSGHLIGQTDALGQPTTFEREVGTNFLFSSTDPLGRVTRFNYDASGNVITATDPLGNVRSFTYEPSFNRLTSLTDPLGNVTRFEYDSSGNLTGLVDPLSQRTTIAYNGLGQPVSMTDPLTNTTIFAYDGTGNLITIPDPLGNVTTRIYDLVSRLLTQTDPRGKITTFVYDPLNRLTSITDALGGQTGFTYDGNGNLLIVTDGRGNSITHEYDLMDRLSRRLDQLEQAETFTYDASGNLVSTTNRKGQTTTFSYDALNRRTRAIYADGSVATFSYDAVGRLVVADDTADPHRPITLAYDLLDRLLAESTALGRVAYQYDALGRRSQMQVNELSPVTYTYDAASRLRTVTQAPLTPVTIDYDAVGRRTRLTLPNAVSTEYQYDNASRLTALIYRNATGLLGDLTYHYDPTGNRTGVGGSFARTLLPDPVASATYDPANRQLNFGDKTMTYDANGNLSSIMDASGATTFNWDVRNRLISLSGPGISASFVYDAFGRRVERTVNAQRSQFQHDIVNVSEEIRDGSPVTHLRGLSVDEIFSTTAGPETRYLTVDTLGSIINQTDANGSIEAEYRYGPFGQMQDTGLDSATPFQFTGRDNDGTGLYYYRLRYYHPTLSRFISQDPLRALTGADLNPYSYVSNSPLNAVDPFGLYEEDVHRDLTFCLARSAGYSSSAARRIAASDQGVDDSPATSPIAGGVRARRDWHFTTEARRTDLWQRALDGNLDHLGQYLHALQDSYSHEGFGPKYGHWTHRPDKTYRDPEKANRMARDTYYHLRQYLHVTTGQPVPDHWDQIREHVDRFNRARTAHEKRKSLCR